jgi:DNA recombination-mediator protein A
MTKSSAPSLAPGRVCYGDRTSAHNAGRSTNRTTLSTPFVANLTEFAPGTQPGVGNFPARNRLISGLGLAVLVTEAFCIVVVEVAIGWSHAFRYGVLPDPTRL